MPAVQAVDAHAHVMRRDAPLAANRHSRPVRDVPVEEYLAVLDAHGVTHGVLTAPSFYGSDNTILLDALARTQGRLRGTAIVEPSTTAAELDRLRGGGIQGIRLNWIRRDDIPDAGSSDYQRLFAAARDCELHIEIYLEGPKLAQVLPQVLRTGAIVVIDHFGFPDPTLRLECPGFRQVLDAVGRQRAWVKLSAPYRLGGVDPRIYVDALLAAGGPQQLMWASDWPWVSHENAFTYAQCLSWLEQWIPDAAQRATVLRDTPARLFGFTLKEEAA